MLSIPSYCNGPCGPQVHLLGARLAQGGGQSASLGRLCPAGLRNIKDEACLELAYPDNYTWQHGHSDDGKVYTSHIEVKLNN